MRRTTACIQDAGRDRASPYVDCAAVYITGASCKMSKKQLRLRCLVTRRIKVGSCHLPAFSTALMAALWPERSTAGATAVMEAKT